MDDNIYSFMIITKTPTGELIDEVVADSWFALRKYLGETINPLLNHVYTSPNTSKKLGAITILPVTRVTDVFTLGDWENRYESDTTSQAK